MAFQAVPQRRDAGHTARRIRRRSGTEIGSPPTGAAPPQSGVQPAPAAPSNAVMAHSFAGFSTAADSPSGPAALAPPAGNAVTARVAHQRRRPAAATRPRARGVYFGPTVWSWRVQPRHRPVNQMRPKRPAGFDELTVYKGDTLVLGLGIIGLNPTNREAYEPLLFTQGNTANDG